MQPAHNYVLIPLSMAAVLLCKLGSDASEQLPTQPPARLPVRPATIPKVPKIELGQLSVHKANRERRRLPPPSPHSLSARSSASSDSHKCKTPAVSVQVDADRLGRTVPPAEKSEAGRECRKEGGGCIAS